MSMENVKDLTESKSIAMHVVRMLQSSFQYPEFGKKGVPVSVAADVFGKDNAWVQAGIISGWLPIGCATQDKKQITSLKEMDSRKRTNYYISPKLLWELTGYVWTGRGGEQNAEQ